jgi:Flp pilus assembly pilin Flp
LPSLSTVDGPRIETQTVDRCCLCFHAFTNSGRTIKGQDIAEYAVVLAVILVVVVGTIKLVGSNANNAFSQVASSIQ